MMPNRFTDWMQMLFGGREVQQDLDAELRFHLEQAIADNIRAGMTPEEARRQALMAIGGIEKTREEYRDASGRLFQDALRDARYGVRALARKPGFTAVAILTLALCIGANTAIFTVVNSVLFRPLPFPEADRLVNVVHVKLPERDWTLVSPRAFDGWLQHNEAFSEMGAWLDSRFVVDTGRQAERLLGTHVSPSLMRALAVSPQLGRLFSDEEEKPGSNQAVLLSHDLWTSQFGADPAIVGRTVLLNQTPHTIVGVMPRSFIFPDRRSQLWTPFHPGLTDPPFVVAALPARESRYRVNYFHVVGRIKPGFSFAEAQARLEETAARVRAGNPGYNMTAGLQPLKERFVSETRPLLLTLSVAVGLVLLIGCANIANLLFVRGTAREKEIALRMALGASRARVLRQLLTESLVLAGAGGILGLLLSQAGVKALVAIHQDLSRAALVSPDGHVLAFAAALSLLTGVVFGCLPALRASGLDLSGSLKLGGAFAGRQRRALRKLLVVGELALCVSLMTGAGLLIRSFLLLSAVDPGFRQEDVISFQVAAPPESGATAGARAPAFFAEVLERVRAIPGVQAAGATNERPFGNYRTTVWFEIEGRPPPKNNSRDFIADFRQASPDYFRAMGIPLVLGHTFHDADVRQNAAVAIIDQEMARKYWPGESPIGAHVSAGTPVARYEIVGVVGSVKDGTLRSDDQGAIYIPWLARSAGEMYFSLSTTAPASTVVPAVRAAVAGVDRNQPVYGVTTMREAVRQSLSTPRSNTLLLTGFACMGLVLASIGVYGLIAFLTEQRKQEMAVRAALGARPRDVLRLIVVSGGKLIAAGMVLGMAGSFGISRLLGAALFGVGKFDVPTLGGVTVLLGACALFATYIPARRATRADPISCLKAE